MKNGSWMQYLWLLLLTFFALSTTACAGLYWESEVVSEGIAGSQRQAGDKTFDQFETKAAIMKSYLTSNAFRTDTSHGITIIEFDIMTMYSLDVTNKTYAKFDMMSVADQGMTKEMTQTQIEQTNETKEIAGYTCKKYNVIMIGGRSEYWMSKDVKGHKEFTTMMKKLEKKFQRIPVMLRPTSMMGLAGKLDGFPVKVVTNVMGITNTTTLKKIEKKSFPKDLFAVPKGYKLKDMSIWK
jgi:hypothetical protein